MNDLKLVDELLCLLKQQHGITWKDMEEKHFLVVRDAMERVRQAWKAHEMSSLTASLARYFDIGINS